MKHICFAISSLTSGGAERVISTLANEFIGQGYLVTIVLVSEWQKKSFYNLNEEINLIALCEKYKKRTNPVLRVRLLKKCFLEIKPDIVIAFLPHICIYSWFALKRTEIPLILSERNDPNQNSLLYRFFLKKAFNFASGCVFQTKDALEWYEKRCDLKNSTIIYNPINVPSLEINRKRKKVVVFVGSSSKRKNVPMMLKAFDKFRSNHAEYTLNVYGSGHTLINIRKYVKVNNISSINIMGRKENWHLNEFDSQFYLSSSNYEGMSNSLAESAALGLTCIATDCPIGGSKELSNYFSNIHLVRIHDFEAMSKAMEQHMFDNTCTKTTIPTTFSVKYICQKWMDFIDKSVKLNLLKK